MPIIRSASDLHGSVLDWYNTDDYSLADKHAFIRGIGTQARGEGAEVLVFPGDTLDERGRNKHLVRDAAVIEEAVLVYGGQAVVQRGNHDAQEFFKRKHMRKLLGKPEIMDEEHILLSGGVLSAHGHGWDKNPQRELALELVHYLLLLDGPRNGETDRLRERMEDVHGRLAAALADVDHAFNVIGRVREYRDSMRQSLLAIWRARQVSATPHPHVGNQFSPMKLVRRAAGMHDLSSPFCAAHLAVVHGCRVALAGHTHRRGMDVVPVWSPQEQRMAEVVVANNGSPIQRGSGLTTVKVDTDAATVELQSFDLASGRFVTHASEHIRKNGVPAHDAGAT